MDSISCASADVLEVLLLLLPSALFLFGVVIYGNFISDGVFVEIGELFEGWGKVGKTFLSVSCER